MLEAGIFPLIVLGLALGLRHGVDWDHIAAIADITSSATTAEVEGIFAAPGVGAIGVLTAPRHPQTRAFFLASLYALGHALVVLVLGALAIWASTILPDWIDPIMERIVGVTLLALGLWIVYSLWRHGRSFQLRSRWMLMFSLVGRGWRAARAALTGERIAHRHDPDQYGPKTAFGVGLIHGIGAETGSQALLLAGAAGATTALSGSLMLLAFVLGLVISNSVVAAFSAFGFVSASAKRDLYVAVGVVAAVFSLVVGTFFVLGLGADLPDLQNVLSLVFGPLGP